MKIISSIYNLFWGDLFYLPLPGGASIGISLLVLILIPVGIYFTIRTQFLPIRCFKDMLRVTLEKKSNKKENSIGSSTAYIEATLAQLHKQEDPLYGGYRGGPCRCHRTSKKCYCKSTRYHGSNHGNLLFCHFNHCDC